MDTSLFFFNHYNICIHVLVYMNDIIVTSNSSLDISLLIFVLSNKKNLSPLSFFLSIQATRIVPSLHLHQEKYVTDLLHCIKLVDAKHVSTPCSFGGKLLKFSGGPLTDSTEYHSMVETLQYLTLTRPDISYSVNQLCQFLHCPTTVHLTIVKQILRHLKGTLFLSLQFTKGSL